MKISIIGANGDIGREISKLLLMGYFPFVRELALFTKSQEGFNYLFSLIEDSLTILRNIHCYVSHNINDLSGSDVIIFCAGKAVATGINSESILKDNRESLFEENKSILDEYIDVLNKKCRNSILLMVSNPVSKLMQYAYNILFCTIVGVGIINDMIRIRAVLFEKFGYYFKNVYAIGDHSNNQNLTYTFSQLPEYYIKIIKNDEESFIRGKDPDKILKDLKHYQEYLIKQNNPQYLFEEIKKLPIKYRVFSPPRNVRKLMVLPVQKMMDIISIS